MIGDYPTQLDKIDQWLYDNFGILQGACSSTENLRYSVARRVAEALWPKTQSLPSDVDEAAENYIAPIENDEGLDYINFSGRDIRNAFIAGAEWQAERLLKGSPMPEDTVIFQKGIEEGKRLMMEEAVEGEVVGQEQDIVEGHHYLRNIIILNNSDLIGVEFGDKVKIVIVREENK